MADLAALGVTLQRRMISDDDAELTELTFTLPRSTGVQATFSAEGFGDKLLKIFKKEIQTGDGIFDEAVLIKTDTEDATAALLESTDVRAIIERVVTSGGGIEIDGNSVKLDLPGRQDGTDEVTELFVRTLLGN